MVQCPERAPWQSPRVCYNHRCRYIEPRNPSARCQVLAKRVENGTGDNYVYVDQTLSFFCEKHKQSECKAEVFTGWPCYNQLRQDTSSKYCDGHRCSRITDAKRKTRCPNPLNASIISGWPVCSSCDRSLGCPAKLPNGERCSVKKLSCGTHCTNHTCQWQVELGLHSCFLPRISGGRKCEEHAGCHFMVDGARCGDRRLSKGAPCERHTCHSRRPGFPRCLSQAERAGQNCAEHAICAWSRDCKQIHDDGSSFCRSHRCTFSWSDSNGNTPRRCPDRISGNNPESRFGKADRCREHQIDSLPAPRPTMDGREVESRDWQYRNQYPRTVS